VYRSNETFILWYASMQVSIQSLENRRRPIQPATINGLGPKPLMFQGGGYKSTRVSPSVGPFVLEGLLWPRH